MTKRTNINERRDGEAGTTILPSDTTTSRATLTGAQPALSLPDPGKPLAEQDPTVLLAMCVFGEARGESEEAQRAVAQVALNRAQHPHPVFGSRAGAAWEDNLRRVLLRRGQFSSFDPADPNYPKLLRPLDSEDAAVWARCLRCAAAALAAMELEDTLTANSDHYFDDSIQPPSWADPAKRTVKLGRLNFYRLYLSRSRGPNSPHNAEAIRGELERGLLPLGGLAEPPSALSPAPLRFHPADPFPSQEPPEAEPASADSPSYAKASDDRPSPAASLLLTSLPGRVPLPAWISRRLKTQRAPRTGRLSSLCPGIGNRELRIENGERRMGSGEWGVGNSRTTPHSLLPTHRLLLPIRLRLAVLSLCLLLAGCIDFERAAYRTLAVTQAEYETLQRHVAEAAVHGLITEEQWDRFRIEGHRFMDAHNAAVDAFALWSRAKSQANAARLEAMLEILPRLVRELNDLVRSLESEPRPSGSGQEAGRRQSEEKLAPPFDSASFDCAQDMQGRRGFPRLRSGQIAPREDSSFVLILAPDFWLLTSS